jgi:hypothetical protein
MNSVNIEKTAEKEFKKFVKHNLLKPKKCKRIDEANYCIQQIHLKIQEFKNKFDYVPASAQIMFNEYKNIQDRMVYENFRETYQNVLC